jgi:hypothetical protein
MMFEQVGAIYLPVLMLLHRDRHLAGAAIAGDVIIGPSVSGLALYGRVGHDGLLRFSTADRSMSSSGG